MSLVSPRLPHLFPPRTLATLLTTTYAAAASVDDEEAHDRVTRALASGALVTQLQAALSRALEARCGPRTSPDKLLDAVSKGIAKRGGNLRPGAATAGLAAVLVRIHVEIGLAPDAMREMLATARGAAALAQGLDELARHVVKELLR